VTHPRGLAVNLALAAACTALVLIAAEAVLRATYEPPVRTFPAHVVARTTTPEYDVEMATNAEGFRDVDHARTKAPGVLRVAVIGDSFVAGSGVAVDSTFVARLERILASDGRRVEMLNFGVSGTGPVHALRVWRRFASHYHPDLAIVCLYAGNDAADAMRESSEAKPRWMLLDIARRTRARIRAWRRPAPAGAPRPDEAARGGWNAFGTDNPVRLDALLEAARRRGVPADSVRARLAAVPDSIVADALAFRSNPFNLAEAVLDPRALRDNVLLDTEETRRGWEYAEKALRELDAETRRAGTRMVLVCIPAGAQVGKRYWWATKLGLVLDDRVLTDPVFQRRVANFAAETDLPLVDLLPALRANAGATLYFEQDGHWTPRGHAFAARAIADGLRRRGIGGEAAR